MNNPILDLIEQQNSINAKAWITFQEDFERRNPPPKEQNRGMWFRAIAIGSIASLSVSGSFTIPAFFNISLATGTIQFIAFIVGFFGFVMVDVMSMIGSHKLVELIYRPQALAGNMNNRVMVLFVGTMTAFSFIVGVTSNLYYMMFGFGVLQEGSQGLQNLSVFLGVLMAFAPPILSSATGAIIALEPLQGIIEREAYETSRNRAWLRYQKKIGSNLDIEKLTERMMENTLSRLESEPEKRSETVSNSFKQANYAQSLNQKAAIQYISENNSEYESIAKTVLEQNPTANQADIARAIAEAMTGEDRGYMTVIRAYKKLGQAVPGTE